MPRSLPAPIQVFPPRRLVAGTARISCSWRRRLTTPSTPRSWRHWVVCIIPRGWVSGTACPTASPTISSSWRRWLWVIITILSGSPGHTFASALGGRALSGLPALVARSATRHRLPCFRHRLPCSCALPLTCSCRRRLTLARALSLGRRAALPLPCSCRRRLTLARAFSLGRRAALPLPSKHVVIWRHAEAINTPTSQLSQRNTLNHKRLPGERDDYDDDDHHDDQDHDEKGGHGDDDNHDDQHHD